MTEKSRDGLNLDVAVIGAGVGGLYALYKMRDELGLNVQSFDDAGGVGGTWYWNRYPGCRVDTEATVYAYSFDEEMFLNWEWSERYPTQPEVLKYLNGVADKHDLKRSINLTSKVVKADWDAATARWTLTTSKGEQITAQFVIEGVGLLSSTKYPGFPGEANFEGKIYHAARWPHEGVDLSGKRVAVIGTGSTGIQIIAALAPQVKHLSVLQRTPQYCVPMGCGPFPQAERDRARKDPKAFRDWHLDTGAVFGFKESTVPAMSVSDAERNRVYESAWEKGGGFGFMLETFGDIIVDKAANKTATDFMIAKINAIVKDPATAAALTPKDYYAKRPLACDNYYETYNRDNVSLVDVKADPIKDLVAEGVRLASGKVVDADVVIYATGFDAVSGNYLKIDTTGAGGLKLKDKWANGPRAMMGLTIAGFPNLFMIFGPFSPFTSQPLVHEWQIDWIAGAIAETRKTGRKSFEVEEPAQDAWIAACNAVAAQTLFAVTDSWINGSNVAGKPVGNMFYMAGMSNYMKEVNALTDAGYQGFKFGT